MGGPDQAERRVDGLTGANQPEPPPEPGQRGTNGSPPSPRRDQLDVSVGSSDMVPSRSRCLLDPRKRTLIGSPIDVREVPLADRFTI